MENEIQKTGVAAASSPKALQGDLKQLFRYWLGFLCAIIYWEIFLSRLSLGAFSEINYWFLLFAASQALVFSALCGWWKDRFDRFVFTVLLFALFFFYAAQFIYYRVFGSMISMSMIGVGGDAVENFGWAMMVTIRESIGLLLLFSLPVIVSIIWIFLRKPVAGKVRLFLRPVVLVIAVALWLLSGAALRLGGTQDSSAYNAYVSSLVDTDTAARKIGVLTTSVMEMRGVLFDVDSDSEIVGAVGNASGIADTLTVPVPAEIPSLPAGSEDTEGAEEEKLQADSVDRSAHILDAIDFEHLASVSTSDTIKSLCEYFASQSGTNKNEYTGLLKDYNLIYICAESFSSYAISEEATPTLYRMANEGIVLTNFYNSFKNTTTNGEFAFMTGLWPDVSRNAAKGVTTGSFGQSAKHYMPYGLGNLFSQIGVKSFAFHNYFGDYYGRNVTHPNLGYLCKFMGKGRDGMKFTNVWPSSDLEMMEQSVDDYITEDRFNVYYMTFSGHGPYDARQNEISYKNLKHIPTLLDGRTLPTAARCYLANNLEVEYSMEYLLKRLEEAGKLDNTLIVLVGDHYPYYLTDVAAKALVGSLPDVDFERYHSTCIMWCGGLEEPIVCDTPCCNVDILPTVLNLMGIEYDSRMLSGTDIFSDSPHVAMLYNKNFITDSVKYNASTGKATWLIDTSELDEETKKAYVENIYAVVKAKYAAALSINNLDFYRFVWENSGLMSNE